MKNFWNSSILVVGVVTLFASGLAYESWYHLWRNSLAYSIIPQDDFYYYYLTAKNFALKGIPSFDGIVQTNGYHPLWFLFLTVLAWFTSGNDHLFFEILPALQILLSATSAYILWSLFEWLYDERPWVAPITLFTSLLLTVLIFSGMETAVAVPFYLLFLLSIFYAETVRAYSYSGLLGCFFILSRLDGALSIIPAMIGFVRKKADATKLLYFLTRFSPIVIYLFYNHFAFGNLIPVSAQAKQLGGWHFSYRAIEAIGTPRGSLYFLLTLIGFILTIHQRNAVKLVLFGFPILLTILLAFHLSWSSYYWYYYPFPIAAAAGVLEILERTPSLARPQLDRFAPVATILVVVLSAVVLQRDIIGLTSKLNLVESETRAQPNIYIHALGIKPFTDTHPGRYAMGDRAGLTAFITAQPILQVEGLAADQAMVDSIAHRADLLNVLRKYGVQYYIVSYPLREFHEQNGWWDLYEPHKQQIQPWAPAMHGSFYAPEVFRFPAPVGATLSHSDSASLWVTRILDISHAHE